MLRDSIHCASANRKVTAAASDHWPMAMAPTTAMSISALMSRANRRAADHARLAQYQPPAAIDTANSAPVSGGRGPEPVQRHAGGHGNAGRDEERLPAVARPDGDARRRVMVQPRAHPRAVHGLRDGRRRELRRVVRDAEGAADDIGAHRFESSQRLEPALEDGHFLVAVHPLDAEHRLRVNLADGAGRGGAGS